MNIPVARNNGPSLLVLSTDVTIESQIPFSVASRYGDVFLGQHRAQGKVALKRLRVDSRNRRNEQKIHHFEKEAALWKSLGHANILPFIGILHQDGQMYLVSPYIPLGTITSYARRLSIFDAETLLLGVVYGLAYLHEQRIIHGDLKGSNILVSPTGEPLICDFGLSRLEDDATSSDQKGAGSARWQSPELHNGGCRSFASDIYAFGMTIFEVLTGELPFRTRTNAVSIIKTVISSQAPRRIPYVSGRRKAELTLWPGLVFGPVCFTNLWPIANDCWQQLSSRRPSAGDVVSRIKQVMAEEQYRRDQLGDRIALARRNSTVVQSPVPPLLSEGNIGLYDMIGRWLGSLTGTPATSTDHLQVEEATDIQSTP